VRSHDGLIKVFRQVARLYESKGWQELLDGAGFAIKRFLEIMERNNLARAPTGLSLLRLQNELICKIKLNLLGKG